jgi:hypothetical protein
MTKFLSSAVLAGAVLLSATGATAQMQAKPKTVATSTKTTKMATRTTTTRKGRMVSAKLANGKTVTYDCSLKGNKTKTACK